MQKILIANCSALVHQIIINSDSLAGALKDKSFTKALIGELKSSEPSTLDLSTILSSTWKKREYHLRIDPWYLKQLPTICCPSYTAGRSVPGPHQSHISWFGSRFPQALLTSTYQTESMRPFQQQLLHRNLRAADLALGMHVTKSKLCINSWAWSDRTTTSFLRTPPLRCWQQTPRRRTGLYSYYVYLWSISRGHLLR